MYKNCYIIFAVIGFVVLLVGIICSWYAFPKLIEYGIAKNIALVEGNMAFDFWKKPPIPLKFRAFFFNVSNPSEVQFGATPIFKEIGPYVFDEYWERVNVSINEEEDTIEFSLKRIFFYNEKETACRSADDIVTIVNGPLVLSAMSVQTLLPAAMGTLNDAIPYLYKDAKDVFIRASIRDILFDGLIISCHDPEVDFVCGAIKSFLPPNFNTANNGSDLRFSLFGAGNNSVLGPVVIGRGLKNTTRGEVISFREQTKMDVWAGPTCNMINGSESSLFYPMKTPPDKIYAFGADICRSSSVSYEKDFLYEGIPTWKYATTFESFGYTGIDDCFCPRVKDENYEDVIDCPPRGLFNIAPCTNAPVLMSNPHFYLADPALLKFAKGLKPEKHLHESYVYFEPITGSPLSGARRVQMNIELKRFEEFTLLNNVSEGVCPMMWIEEIASAPKDLSRDLATVLNIFGKLNYLKWAFIILGISLLLASFVLKMYREKMMCFAHVSSGKVAVTHLQKINKGMGIKDTISNINFNNTILYPSLYPQIYEKNVHDRLIRRNNFNVHNKNVLQFKN